MPLGDGPEGDEGGVGECCALVSYFEKECKVAIAKFEIVCFIIHRLGIRI